MHKQEGRRTGLDKGKLGPKTPEQEGGLGSQRMRVAPIPMPTSTCLAGAGPPLYARGGDGRGPRGLCHQGLCFFVPVDFATAVP